MSLVVRLDVRTRNPLNGSQGQTVHGRRMRAAERKKLRLLTHNWCRFAMVYHHHKRPVSAIVMLTRIAPCPLDDDGWQAAAKPIRDGVADWLCIKDNDPRFTWNYAQRRGRVREHAVLIEIEPRKEVADAEV